MTLVEYITIGIYILVYTIVFIIQKSQFDKQKSIMEKYEKMFSIINIDEIEKYVNLKEQSLKLQFENREKEIEKIEKRVNKNIETSEKLKEKFSELDIEKEEINLMLENAKQLISNRKIIDEEILELNDEQFNKIFDFAHLNLKSLDELESLKIEKELFLIRNEYLLKHLELRKKIKPII